MVILSAWESLQTTFNARKSEWFLALAFVNLGVVSVMNSDLFADSHYQDVLEIGKFAAKYLHVEPITLWTVGFFVVGFSRLAVLFINGAWWRTPLFRSSLAFLSCFLWFQMWLGLAANVSWDSALILWVFALDGYNALTAAHEAGFAQAIHHHSKEVSKNGGSSNRDKS